MLSLGKLINIIRLIEAISATAAYAAVACLLIIDVIGRELFKVSFLGSQQLAVYGAILAGFLGLTIATSDNSHLRPEFMDFLLKKYDHSVKKLGDFISGMFFLGACYVAWTFVEVSMEARDRAPVHYFLVWPLQMIIPYAFASAGLKHLIFCLRPELKPDGSEKI